MPRDVIINEHITIPGWRLVVETSRAGGPGGQHVNTTDTAVRVRLHLGSVSEVHPAVLARIRVAFPSYVTSMDELVVSSRASRSQSANLESALVRLAEMFRAHLHAPRPRRATKPTKSSQRRRLEAKTQRGRTKSLRGRVDED